MWIVNQLYWQDAPTYRALADASEKLRAAHRAALGGRKIDTRTPDQLYRTTVEKAFAKAVGIAEKKGVRATDTVRDAVRRTLDGDPYRRTARADDAGARTSRLQPADRHQTTADRKGRQAADGRTKGGRANIGTRPQRS